MPLTWMTRLLHGNPKLAARRAKHAKTFRPSVEALENRLAPAGLTVTDLTSGVITPTDLVRTLQGTGLSISNVTYKGATIAAGEFSGGTGIIGFDSGVILSTGHANAVIGPHGKGDPNAASFKNNQPGDPALVPIATTPVATVTQTFDASDLEFDFVPLTSTVSFQFVFASDEYNESVNTTANDVFAAFVNGTNVALTPGTRQPITINTINNGNPVGTTPNSNPSLFISNEAPQSAGLNTTMDGLTVVLTATATVIPNQVNHAKLEIADSTDPLIDSDVFIKAGSFSSPLPRGQIYAVGADFGGGPEVRVFSAQTHQELFGFFAYSTNFLGGVRVAVGDVNGDGVPDIITAPGPTGGPDIRVFDGSTGQMIDEFLAYSPQWLGGVYVAAGDVNGDGHADIITGPDAGGGPEVKVFSGANTSKVLMDFMAYSQFFTGGVRVAAGDVNGDGKADIITGAGPGGGPQVKAFSGANGSVLQSFYAYNPAFLGGVYVGTGQFGTQTNGQAHEDIITGAGAGGGPQVTVFNGATGAVLQSFMAETLGTLFYDDGAGAAQAGVRVAGVDITGDGVAEILCAFGPPHDATVKAFSFATGAQIATFDAFPGFNGGVFVGGV
jgi:hypothetical protein